MLRRVIAATIAGAAVVGGILFVRHANFRATTKEHAWLKEPFGPGSSLLLVSEGVESGVPYVDGYYEPSATLIPGLLYRYPRRESVVFGDGKHLLTVHYGQHGIESTHFMVETGTGSVSWGWVPSWKYGLYHYSDYSGGEIKQFDTIVEEDQSLREPCPATTPYCDLTSAIMTQLRAINVDWKPQSRLGFGQLSYWDDHVSLEKEPDREYLKPKAVQMRETMAAFTRLVDQNSTGLETRSVPRTQNPGGGVFED